jgi:hypothetical protein
VRERRQAGEGFRSTGRDGQYGLGVIRVLLADDEMMVRAGVKAILAAASDIEVVAEAGDGHEALELARAYRLDVRNRVQAALSRTRRGWWTSRPTRRLSRSARRVRSRLRRAMAGSSQTYLVR